MFVYLHFNIPLYQTNRFGCGNVSDEQAIELAWNVRAFYPVANSREGLLVYK